MFGSTTLGIACGSKFRAKIFASPPDPPYNNSDRSCGELWENGFTQLNRVVPPLAIIDFNALDLLKGYSALGIADDQAWVALFWKNAYPCRRISAWENVALVDAMISGT